jgi:MFS family permease
MALIMAVPMASMPVLFKQMSEDLSLNSVQIGLIWGIFSLGSIFVAPIGGAIYDRIGYKRAIVILGILSGLTGAARGLSDGFLSILMTTLIWGLVSSALMLPISMVGSISSSRQRQGLAQGLLATGGAAGLAVGSMTASTLLSPLLGGWRNVVFALGGVAILMSLFWLRKLNLPNNVKQAVNSNQVSFGQAMSHLLRSKPLWILSLSLLAYQGCVIGMQGYLVYFLENFGWTAVAASGVLTAYNLAGGVSAIPFTLLSDRLGKRKNYLVWSFITTIAGIGLLAVVHNGFVWVLVILAGLLSCATVALYNTICIEILYKESVYIGTGMGVMISIANIGRTVAPPLGNSLADISATIAWPFIFWAALGVAGVIQLGYVRETGWTNRKKKI